MAINSRDYPLSDGLERRLIEQAPRNRQLVRRRECAPARAGVTAPKFLAQLQALVHTTVRLLGFAKIRNLLP